MSSNKCIKIEITKLSSNKLCSSLGIETMNPNIFSVKKLSLMVNDDTTVIEDEIFGNVVTFIQKEYMYFSSTLPTLS